MLPLPVAQSANFMIYLVLRLYLVCYKNFRNKIDFKEPKQYKLRPEIYINILFTFLIRIVDVRDSVEVTYILRQISWFVQTAKQLAS